MASTDHIRYDLLAQDALRGVVRRVIQDVARDGLPGDHHFFIAFDTRAPGVRLSQRMREKYPEEMTVVLQHQFWDLVVSDVAFEVGLSFGGVPEKLVVPFSALKGFFDPSVKFGLQFELAEEATAGEADAESPDTSATPSIGTISSVRSTVRGAASEPVVASGTPVTPAAASNTQDGDTPEDERPSGGAEVVRLDVFRKK
ncbi:SspB family protein [Aquabacter cavernae]|uniref:SspB family protein n=1 Tax=Aquabacter cavernae TaxID=2496029 RepID=UPI000F8E4A29|nr:ClpXP protease specificity-enhancing factor SspB [Aquabacter cavernae]